METTENIMEAIENNVEYAEIQRLEIELDNFSDTMDELKFNYGFDVPEKEINDIRELFFRLRRDYDKKRMRS